MSVDLTPLLESLSSEPPLPDVYNPYHLSQGERASICCANLSYYFETHLANRTNILLIGEALGHRGGRLTGIPFTSEQILLDNRYQSLIDFAPCQVLNRASPAGEQTATIVWNGFSTLKYAPLCWNAFPFHPHKPDAPTSNRPPSAKELAIGCRYIELILSLCPQLTLVAVGRRAERALSLLDMPHRGIRHPSHGGKRAFLSGLKKVVNQALDDHN